MLKDFLYEIIESGDPIFVECEEIEEVPEIMRKWGFNMEELEYQGEYSVEEAEEIGYDTYTC